ncbi:MAG: TRAP transporter small permease subunit [Pseudooceanicola nanhaiensis]|uniref:TRAP transporter small permease subunit n=1 Tax=Rhodobacterales TaxID=204455 RepID=UPI004059F7C9
MTILVFLDRGIQLLARMATAAAGAVVLILMLLGISDRVATELFARPVPSAIEFQRLFEAVLIFLGLAGVQHQRAHIRIDLLVEIFGNRVRRFCDIFGLLVSTAFYLLIAWQGYYLAAKSIAVREVSTGRIDIPIYPFKVFVVAGMAIALLEAARQLVRLLADRAMSKEGAAL